MTRLTATELLPANRQLDHIPGTYGLPIFGNALEWMRDPRGLAQRNLARFGPVHRTDFMRQRSVSLVGADALQMVLQDRDQIFSSQFG